MRPALVLIAFVCSAIWLVPTAFSGIDYVECSFEESSGELQVHVRDEDGVIRRNGEAIQVLQPTGQLDPDGRLGWDPVSCGGSPTVTNTDLIRLQIGEDADTDGRVSLFGGPLAPGSSPEVGVPEIELVTSFVGNPGDEAIIEGSREADFFRGGRISGENWLNLNAAVEGTSPDADMHFGRIGKSALGFDAHAGADQIDLTGGPEFEAAMNFKAFVPNLGPGPDLYATRRGQSFVRTGPGADQVATGDKFDFVIDRSGKDTIKTHGGRDFIAAGRGADRISSGKGKDLIAVFDPRGRIRCGGGRDRVVSGKPAPTKSCERVRIAPLAPRPGPFGH